MGGKYVSVTVMLMRIALNIAQCREVCLESKERLDSTLSVHLS